MKQPLKSITELGPLAVFFITYKIYGIIYATAALVATTAITTLVAYYVIRKVPLMPLITVLVVSFFGILTIASGDEIFIKLKPTIINVIFAAILFVGYVKNKGLLKYLFDGAMHMSDHAWKVFSLRWAMFFIIMACANEFVWRNFSTDLWVDFKVFGILGITFIFLLTQLPFIQKNIIEDDKV